MLVSLIDYINFLWNKGAMDIQKYTSQNSVTTVLDDHKIRNPSRISTVIKKLKHVTPNARYVEIVIFEAIKFSVKFVTTKPSLINYFVTPYFFMTNFCDPLPIDVYITVLEYKNELYQYPKESFF